MQISIQSPDPEENDRIAGNRSFAKKLAAARVAKELDFPLTINCVLHRQNLDRIEELLELTLELGAQRLELANTQYYGWAVAQPGGADAVAGAAASARRRPSSASVSGSARRSTCCGCSPTSTRSCRSRAWAAGAGRRWWWLRTARSCPARPRRRSPGSSSPTSATIRWSGSGTSPTRSRASAARTGCRSRAGRARSGARRRIGAAAAARRCGSRATRRPRIRSAGSRRITTVSSRRASRRRPMQFVYRTMKRPRGSTLRARARAARPGRCGGRRAPPRAPRPP